MEQSPSAASAPNSEPIYEPEALKIVDIYRQEINSILADTTTTEQDREELLTAAAMKYHDKMDGFSETQQMFAWFSLSSEDEWQAPIH